MADLMGRILTCRCHRLAFDVERVKQMSPSQTWQLLTDTELGYLNDSAFLLVSSALPVRKYQNNIDKDNKSEYKVKSLQSYASAED